MKNIIVLVIFFLLMLNITEAGVIKCYYQYGLESIEINTDQTKNIEIKFEKKGIKHKYFIKDANNFNELEDYLSQENDEGHKITYHMACFYK